MPVRGPQGQTEESTLAHAALLYYGEGLTQGEIARRMGVSRATIVSYLKMARDLQIVDIRIQGKGFAQSTLALAVKDRYGLEDVYVVPTDEDEDDEDRLTQRVATVAAMSLSYLLEPEDRLGVAWGRTIQHVAFQFPMAQVPKLTVFQIIGSMHSNQLFSAENCSIEIARRTGAICRTLHVPAVVSTPELAIALKAEPQIRDQFNDFEALTKVVFSVGHIEAADAHIVEAGITKAKELPALRKDGAAGVVCGQFIDAFGKSFDCALHDRILGIRPESLARAPMRMMVVAGVRKRRACHAALTGKLCSHLVIDEATARWLMKED